MSSQLLLVTVGTAALIMIGMVVMIAKSWHSVPQGQALIINGMQGEPRVSFTGAIVMPIVHRAERIELAVRQIEIERRGKEGVICKDCIRADLKVTFSVRVNRTTGDIVRVAQTVGAARASDPATLRELFTAKFSEAIKTVVAKLDFDQLYVRREEVKDQILEVIGRDLNGYVLDDAAIDYLEQTPIDALDPNNVLDSVGIKKILQSSQGIEELRLQRRLREASAATTTATEADSSLHAELERLGLLDLRVATEVSCDVAPGRNSVTVSFEGDVEAVTGPLPSSVPKSVLAAIGRGELTCRDGRATFRWHTYVTTSQVIAGARLVHAMRDDDRAYR